MSSQEKIGTNITGEVNVREGVSFYDCDNAAALAITIEAVRQNPTSCPSDAFIVVHRNNPLQGIRFADSSNLPGPDEKDLAVLGHAGDLFETFDTELVRDVEGWKSVRV